MTVKTNKVYDKFKKSNSSLFWCKEKKYEDLWGSINDLVAVRKSLKPLFVTVTSSKKRFKALKDFCKREGLIFGFKKYNASSDEKWNQFLDRKKHNDNYNIFISKKKELINKAKKMVHRGFTLNEGYNSKEFGLLLGYPSCCVENYDKVNILQSLRPYICNKIPFYTNILLTGTGSNCRLMSHSLCSFNCKKTIELDKKILNVLKKEIPDYYHFLMKYLKKPLLFWVNGRQGNFGLSDTLTVFVFDGELKNNVLNYKKVHLNFPINLAVKLVNSPSVKEIEDIIEGNKLVIKKDFISVHKDKKLLRKVKRGEQSAILVDPV